MLKLFLQSLTKKISPHLPIIGIILLGALLRLPQLDQVPNGFYSDEAAIGYDAYSIMQTGRDHWGDTYPLFARSFGDYDEATYRYLVIPAIHLFGLTEFATRLPAALAGILTIWAIYGLCCRLFDKRIALWVALFLAISPWHILFSRWAVRAILLPLFFCWGLTTFLKGFQKPAYFIFSALLFAISLHTYNSARVFVPLFLIGLIFLYRKPLWQHRQYTLPAGFLFALVFGYLCTFWISPQGMQRARHTLTTDVFALPLQYLSYYNPYFLFWRGDNNVRHSIEAMGQLHHLEIIPILIGLYGFIRSRHTHKRILYLWLLLYPIPASLTASTHAIRAIMGTPLFAILSGYGMQTLYLLFQKQKRLITFGTASGIVVSLVIFYTNYFIDYAAYSAYWWQHGIREGIQQAEKYPYPCQIEPAQPYSLLYIFVLFYTQFSPETYHTLPQQNKDYNWKGVPLGKYTIMTLPDSNATGPQLYLTGAMLYSLLVEQGRSIQDLHTIEDPAGRGVLLKLIKTNDPNPLRGNTP